MVVDGELTLGRARVRRFFACVASALMLAVAFHVAIMPGSSSPEWFADEIEVDSSGDGLSDGVMDDLSLENVTSHKSSPPSWDNASGDAIESFGVPIVSASTLKEKIRFAGEMQDSSSGLYYIFARYMDPELGRWYSLDSELGKLSMPQSMNRYVYCVNNPLRFTDPTGMWLESLFDIGCIIYDIHELWKNPTWGNAGWLHLDIGCLILPGVPALSPVLKTWKWFDKANDARKIAGKGDDLFEVRNADEAIDV